MNETTNSLNVIDEIVASENSESTIIKISEGETIKASAKLVELLLGNLAGEISHEKTIEIVIIKAIVEPQKN